MSAEQQIPPRRGDLSRVTVTINGRRFRMACEPGQEAHLRRLAGDLDQRIGRLRGDFGEIGNTQLTVMAALTISDELVEMGGRLRALERELAACRTQGSPPPIMPKSPNLPSRRRSTPLPSASRASPDGSIARVR